MRAKSGVWKGSVLGWANGLDAGSVAEAAALALRGAAAETEGVTTASAAVARRMLRIICFPGTAQGRFGPLQPLLGLRKPEYQPLVERTASIASP